MANPRAGRCAVSYQRGADGISQQKEQIIRNSLEGGGAGTRCRKVSRGDREGFQWRVKVFRGRIRERKV